MLDSLLEFADIQASNSEMTLMHYLCKVLASKSPVLLDFHVDLVSLESSSKIQMKYLANEMEAISKGLEKVEQELVASENDGPVSIVFQKVSKHLTQLVEKKEKKDPFHCNFQTINVISKGFVGSAELEVRRLKNLHSQVSSNADALARYFGEDPARYPFEQGNIYTIMALTYFYKLIHVDIFLWFAVAQILFNFVRLFRKAHEENCKQAEK
ncbi:putative formin, FH2 domain-containing protein [Helianthus annuus]|nr:putative formin, FH2 domain-containing protein [Helianthus annuus]